MFKPIKIVLATFVLCLALQFAAFCIPQAMIMDNILESAYTLKDGGIYSLVPGYYSLQMDNFTDSWMLNIASYSGEESALEKAFGAYYYDFAGIPTETGIGPHLALTEILNGNYDLRIGSYARYWHGYIFFLRLALTIMNHSDIRLLSFFMLFGLSLYLFYLMANEKKRCCIPFALCIMFLCPLSAFFCMAYSGVLYIALLSSILLIKKKWWLNQRSMLWTAFVVIGMLTSWIDLLSFPLITLGIPLVIVACFADTKSYKEALGNIFLLSACWGVGYAGMWGMKWVLGGLVLQTNVIADAIGAARVRASNTKVGDQSHISLVNVITETWGILNKKSYLTAMAVAVAGGFYALIRKGGGATGNRGQEKAAAVADYRNVPGRLVFYPHGTHV